MIENVRINHLRKIPFILFSSKNISRPVLYSAFRSNLKIRIFGRNQGVAEDQPAGMLKYVKDLRRGLNADIGRKDFFEIASGDIQDRNPAS
jgi:hypothetical protein